jgi:hypothetical protein
MLLSEIASYLESKGVGTRGVDLFAGEIPLTAPEIAVGLIETGGGPPAYVHGKNEPVVVFPGIQLRVRAADYEIGRSRIDAIVKELTFRDAILGGVRYLSVVPVQEPIDVGRDDNDRHQFVCNFEIMKEPS